MEMKMSFLNRISALVIAAIVALAAGAQNPDIVSHINKGGKVKVTVPSGLLQRPNPSAKSPATTQAEENEQKSEDPAATTSEEAPRRMHTTSQTMQGRKVGFRIQCYSGNSKADAQQRARTIAMKFPHFRTYISYNAPLWRLRVGDFKDRTEGVAALGKLRGVAAGFANELILVKDNINLWSN